MRTKRQCAYIFVHLKENFFEIDSEKWNHWVEGHVQFKAGRILLG